MNSPNDDRFDDLLRQQLDFPPRPIAGGWDRLRGQLPPPPRPAVGARLRPFGGGIIVGALLWWGAGQWPPHGTTVPAPRAVAAVEQAPAAAETAPAMIAAAPMTTSATPTAVAALPITISGAAATISAVPTTISPASPASVRPLPTTVSPSPATSSALPATISPLSGAIAVAASSPQPAALSPAAEIRQPLASPGVRHIVGLDTAIQRTLAATDTGRTTRLRALLHEQTRALAALQQQIDSLKQALPEAPPALATQPMDSAKVLPPAVGLLPPPRSPWAVVGLLETTPSWSTLPAAGPGVDQERTQAALAQSVQLQRQVGSHWRLRAGFGQAALRTQARYTSERTTTTQTRDSITTTSIQLHAGTRWVRIINSNTHDTSFVLIATYDTIYSHNTVRTYRTTTLRDQRQQLLRPDYRFWTIPLSAHYLLVNRNRWSLSLSLGAQATIFRGGTRPVWNGEEYALQRVGPRDGPYRPVSLSVSGGLEAQYRLGPQWSVLVAPTVRWWAVQPGKGGAATRSLLPAAQVGLSYGF